MSDTFTETTTKSWFSRVASSVAGVLFGFLLVLAMIVGLFWNEGRAVTTARSLAEGGGAVVSVGSDTVDPANEGRLVHVSGPVTSDETLTDPDFGISAVGVALIRRTEMYQWKEDKKSETRTKLGGGEETVTTYSYSRGWDDERQDSSGFKVPAGHENPDMQWNDRTFALDSAAMGAWRLDTQVLSRMGGEAALSLKPSDQATIAAAYGDGAKVAGGRIYLGQDPAAPRIGDQRIGYELAPLGDISVVAKQRGDGFAYYQTQAGDALLMVDRGRVSAADMFAAAVSANTAATWILRVVGLLLLAVGFGLIMGPIGVLLDVLPFLGSIARMGTGVIAFVLAILVGGAVIAFAWFWYRPLLAIGILVAAGAFAWGISRLGKARQQPAPAATA
ncbi:MAG: TMEM43 family protein [Mesorhizobium sp.]|nr:TMEM43 family protein [Mesorhizobium sp.]